MVGIDGEAHQSGGATYVAELLSDVSKEATSLSGYLNGTFEQIPSDFVQTTEGSKLLRPDQRLSAGLTYDGREVATLFVERPGGSAMDVAEGIKAASPGRVDIRVTGSAHAAWPSEPRKGRNGCSQQPGASIGHYAGFAGTLGCLVQVRDRGKSWVGAMGASHVLANSGSGESGDAVLCPCPPDGRRVMGSQIGTLENSSILVHHKEAGGPGRATNTEDAAVVRFLDQSVSPQANLVPDPEEPRSKRLRITGHVAAAEWQKYVGKQVYKFGRTTGFRRGWFDGITTESHSIRLPDNRIYFYQATMMVTNDGKRAFSEPGDSGALVYATDGTAIGLVIGASAELTYVSPMFACLEAMNAELLV